MPDIYDRRQALGLVSALGTESLLAGQTATRIDRLADARSQPSPADVISLGDRGDTVWRRASSADILPPDERDFSWFETQDHVRYLLVTAPAPLEAFGCIGDCDPASGGGTDNTRALQAAFNYSRRLGATLTAPPGAKYLTDTIYCHYHPILNPVGKAFRPGRFALVGQASGIATGETEHPGCALVHKPNSRGPLLSCVGSFSLANPAAMGGQIYIDRFNFLGGYDTTDVLYFEACQGQIWLSNYTVRILNPSGNGVTENSTWETIHLNGLIMGPGRQQYPSDPGFRIDQLTTGIGLNICDNRSNGQVNMKIYQNVNCYGNGYGVRIGRRQGSGTFGPLIFLGGQSSHCDQHGFWIDGGVISLSAIGYQIENTRLNGLRIDSAGSSDIPRSIKWQNGYFASCGRSNKVGNESFAVYIGDGENVELDMPVFQETYSGIIFDRSRAFGLTLHKPQLRTTTQWGSANGTFISAFGDLEPSMRIVLEDPIFIGQTRHLIDESAQETFARSAAGEVLATTPKGTASIALSFRAGTRSARVLQLNSPQPTQLTDIADGTHHQMLLLEFQDTNTIVRHGTAIALAEGRDFTPSNASATLLLYRDASSWREIARSGDRRIGAWRTLSASAQSLVPQSGSGHLLDVPVQFADFGLDGALTLDLTITLNAPARLSLELSGGGRWPIELDSGQHEVLWRIEGRGSPKLQLVSQRQGLSSFNYAEVMIDMRQSGGRLVMRADAASQTKITIQRHELRLRTGAAF